MEVYNINNNSNNNKNNQIKNIKEKVIFKMMINWSKLINNMMKTNNFE